MDLSIRVSGAAGQGIETIGGLLTSAFAAMGLHVFTTETYMSRIRGGLNWMDIRIADQELFSGKDIPDLLVVLDPKGSISCASASMSGRSSSSTARPLSARSPSSSRRRRRPSRARW